MTNQLAQSASPYLLQHKDNPVHWQEWSAAAFVEARERDVPVLLSIGYSACHWCHVMAHESFEDEATAAQMNNGYVCIKVDREERPDLDAVYMDATVAMTGQGGWPMTCFLTPDGEPFHCGTYFPPTPRHGMPSFSQLLAAVSDAWTNRRSEVLTAGASVVAELERAAGALPTGAVDAAVLDAAAAVVLRDFDAEHGGFGGAPKFPPAMVLEALLRHHERTGDEQVLAVVQGTADRMARGGIHDQLAGGFSRYSVDAGWVVPHFEKMLYDNALLLRMYGHLYRATGSALALRVAESTARFLLTALRTDEGGFASALDADTEGVEGLTYAWTPAQLTEVLGDEDGAWAAQLLTVTPAGTFEHGSSVLQLLANPEDTARWSSVQAALLAARAERPQPGRDDKVVTAWNGLAITTLAEAGAALGRDDWVAAAVGCAEHLLATHMVDGRLRRSSLGGAVGTAAGVLDDHASFALGLFAVHQATGQLRWLEDGCTLVDLALRHFADPDEGGAWFDTADDAEALVRRPRDPLDGVTPSGASGMAEALQAAAALAERDRSARYAAAADATLGRAGMLLARAPRSSGNWWSVAEAAQRGPLQVAVAGSGPLLSFARMTAPGGTLIVGGDPDSTPLLAGRALVDGAPAAYVCRGFVCDRPVASEAELSALLGYRAYTSNSYSE
jgi:uncharacterized protein